MQQAVEVVAVHPAQRSYGVNPFELKAGDVLMRDGLEYRVAEGFREDRSSCWRGSRYVQATQLTGRLAGQLTYVNPTGSSVSAVSA